MDPLTRATHDALAIAAAGGDPCDVGPLPGDTGEWEKVLAVLRPAILGAAHTALAVATTARRAGDESTAAAVGEAVTLTHYQRCRAALAGAGLPTPDPDPDVVQGWVKHYATHGYD